MNMQKSYKCNKLISDKLIQFYQYLSIFNFFLLILICIFKPYGQLIFYIDQKYNIITAGFHIFQFLSMVDLTGYYLCKLEQTIYSCKITVMTDY
jgi:hypothetical protein